jgi:hypothetical protein
MPEPSPDRCGEPEFAIAAGGFLLVVVGLAIAWACWGSR